jgi:hypothetical protein
MVCIVVSVNDRVDVSNSLLAIALDHFLQNVNWENIMVVFNNCNQVNCTDEYVQEWI